MPLIAHSESPVFSHLLAEGVPVARQTDGLHQFNIGLLNLMPEAALEATERQWMRLSAMVPDRAIFVYPFTFTEAGRSATTQSHIDRYYDSTPVIEQRRLDLLIVTGANPEADDLSSERFWRPLIATIARARALGCPVVCSCLAAHAVLKEYYGIERVRLPEKCWGVFPHRLIAAQHPLVEGIASDWHAPHSHFYGVAREPLEAAGIDVLVDSAEAGVYLAASRDFPGFVFLQGHPEYDANTLLKEFKREVGRFLLDELPAMPRAPVNYFPPAAEATLAAYQRALAEPTSADSAVPDFPEDTLQATVQNRWRACGRQLFQNLIRAVPHGD